MDAQIVFKDEISYLEICQLGPSRETRRLAKMVKYVVFVFVALLSVATCLPANDKKTAPAVPPRASPPATIGSGQVFNITFMVTAK